MQLNTLIQKRFQELAEKADVILAAKYLGQPTRTGGRSPEYVPYSETAGWGTNVLSLFRQAFGESNVHTQHFQKAFDSFSGYVSSFKTLHALFSAAREDFEGGYIFTLQGLVKAEVLTDALEQAQDLLKAGYKDPACVLIGVSLEVAIKHLAGKHSVPLTKLDRMNSELGKIGAYNMAKQKQVTAWADLRNKAAHGEWSAYTATDVVAMHSWVQQFVADFL
jgi:hypothetical protein